MLNTDDQAIIDAGYKPQLYRRLGFFSSFGISFSYMSVLTGIYANFGFALDQAGPFGVWTWILVGLGQTLTALVFAEMAGRIPLTGCSYNWNQKLTNSTVGWFAGWMALVAYTVGVAAVTVTVAPLIMTLTGLSLPSAAVPFLGLAILFLQAILNIYGVRVAAYVNLFAVSAEIFAVVGFGALLAAVWLSTEHHDVSPITMIPSSPTPYLPAFLMASLLGAWTLLGFEGAADISEETVNVRQVAPRAIIRAAVICSILGLIFTIILTLCVGNLGAVTDSSDPVSLIMTEALGLPLTRAFQVLLLLSIVACSLVNMTGATRVLFAMARDGRIVGSKWLSCVSEHRVPGNATWIVTLFAAIFLLIADSATALYGAGTVLFTLFYLVTVIGYAVGLSRLPTTTSFTLGRWRQAVVPLAIAWLLLEVAILTIPSQFHLVAIATVIVLVVGAGFYVIAGRRPSTPRQARQGELGNSN